MGLCEEENVDEGFPNEQPLFATPGRKTAWRIEGFVLLCGDVYRKILLRLPGADHNVAETLANWVSYFLHTQTHTHQNTRTNTHTAQILTDRQTHTHTKKKH